MRILTTITTTTLTLALSAVAAANGARTYEGTIENRGDRVVLVPSSDRDGLPSPPVDVTSARPSLALLAGFQAKVRGYMGNPRDLAQTELGQGGPPTFPLNGVEVLDPEPARLEGVVRSHGQLVMLETEDGEVPLQGAPQTVLVRLDGRRIRALGFLFEDSFWVSSVQGRVKTLAETEADGDFTNPWLSPTVGPGEDPNGRAPLEGDEMVSVTDLAIYDKKTGGALSIDDLAIRPLAEQERIFAKVRLDDDREGWLPARRLEIGEATTPAAQAGIDAGKQALEGGSDALQRAREMIQRPSGPEQDGLPGQDEADAGAAEQGLPGLPPQGQAE